MKIEVDITVLAKFIIGIIGPHCEVVVHDLSDAAQSVIAIENGYITGRSVGSPATDFALKKSNDIKIDSCPFDLNYRGVSENGLVLRSSTLVVTQNNEIRYLLCVNIDDSKLNRAVEDLKSMIPSVADNIDQGKDETFHTSIDDLSENILHATMKKMNIFSLKELSTEQKIEFVKEIDASGLFKVKGYVQKIAKKINISDQTLYRYLQKD